MPVRYSGGGGGIDPGGDADTVWDDDLHLTDKIAPQLVSLDTLHLTDSQLESLRLPDTLHLIDARVLPTGVTSTATKAETLNLGESTIIAQISERPYADAYTIEGAGNPGAGTTTLLVSNNGAATTGRDAYLKINLRNDVGGPFEGMVARASPNNDILLRLTVSNDLGTGADVTVTSLIQDADPWQEDTITFANAPAHNTAEGEFPVVGSASNVIISHILTSKVGTVIGNWLSVRLRMNTVTQLSVLTFASKENAIEPNRPLFGTFTIPIQLEKSV